MAFRVRHPPHSAWKRITKARTSDAGEDALRRLRSFLDAKEPEIVRLLARLWGDQQQAITYQELRTAILNGYIDEQTAQDWMNDYSHFVNEKLRPQWEDAMRAANARLEAEHPGLFFNAHDPGVQEWISTRGGELITVIGWEQRQAINAMVGRAYAGEWTVDELARAIRPTIGLNRPQAAANLNYYERTKATLLQNNPSMREATAEKRAREAAVKYAEKQHRYRAFMIARTEMAFAYNRGMDEGIKQAIAKGYMGACVRVWVTAADERMCPVCGELEGVEIGMEGQYDFSRVNSRLPSGPTPPAHPNCRCAVDYREIAPPAYSDVPTDIPMEAEESMEPEDLWDSIPRLETANEDMLKVGEIDRAKLASMYSSLLSGDLILTAERLAHIRARHPEDADLFIRYGEQVIQDPDLILNDDKNRATVMYIRAIESTNLNIIVRLALAEDAGKSHSIMTAYRLGEKTVKRLKKKNKILYFRP